MRTGDYREKSHEVLLNLRKQAGSRKTFRVFDYKNPSTSEGRASRGVVGKLPQRSGKG